MAKIDVAPLAGARIEIGIKDGLDDYESVVPLAGARIEILMQDPFNLQVKCRSPRGSDD